MLVCHGAKREPEDGRENEMDEEEWMKKRRIDELLGFLLLGRGFWFGFGFGFGFVFGFTFGRLL